MGEISRMCEKGEEKYSQQYCHKFEVDKWLLEWVDEHTVRNKNVESLYCISVINIANMILYTNYRVNKQNEKKIHQLIIKTDILMSL